jgi:7,8-dihydropterin-6-yl-methyl-4-(beta-D-ribofuranosyl)aminobenzene 5'-phosphate synthase
MESSRASFDVKIIYGNRKEKEKFLTDFGFSALIYSYITESYILFDTGTDGAILINNLKEFGVETSSIKKIVISHNHREHSGGLISLYNEKPDIEIFVPIENLISYRRTYPKSNVNGVSDLTGIDKNIFTSGQLGNYLKEQSLFLQTLNNEVIVIVGCAHPGLDEIISLAKTIGPVKGVLGGFHGLRNFTCLQGVKFIGPCHCTQNLDLLKDRFPEQYKEIGVGKSFTF